MRFSGAEISMAIRCNGLIKYIFSNTKSMFLKTVVTQSNYDRVIADFRNAKWAPDIEKLMEQVEPGCTFLFFTDYKLVVDRLL